MKFGALLWSQSSWSALCDAAVAADRAGWDSLWTWDHLMAIQGPWDGPIHEGWTTIAAWAALTQRATVGLMVGANTFRNPGLTAKLAITVDHISRGRAVLGLGGAWFEREHEGYGIDFGSGFGERLDRLDEASMLIRRLLDGERIDRHEGRFYRMTDALCEPGPVNGRLPLLIGGSGPQKTMRTAARYADAWNTGGSTEDIRRKDGIFRERCEEVGRDERDVERTFMRQLIIRDDPAEARRVWEGNMRANGKEPDDGWFVLAGPPAHVADELRPLQEMGFDHVIAGFPRPDIETIERLDEVREHLAG